MSAGKGLTNTGLAPPTGSRVFTGRATELASAANVLLQSGKIGPAVIMISGMPGVGKTEFAIRLVREVSDHYVDGVFWVSLRTYAARESRVATTEALRIILNTVGVPPDQRADTARLSQQWRQATSHRQILLVLDDADASEQVLPLLPSAQGSAVLVTSRHVLVGLDPDESIRLDVLGRADALKLTKEIFARASFPDSGKASAIAEHYRLPLAIRQLSNLMVSDPAMSINDLDTIIKGRDEVAASFLLSINALNAQARRILCRVGNYPGARISVAVAAVLADVPVTESRALLADIYRRGLLGSERNAEYRMHDLVRAVAQRQAITDDSPAGQRDADNRLVFYVGETLAYVNQLAYPIGPGPYRPKHTSKSRVTTPLPVVKKAEALNWLDGHLADLLAITRRAIILQWDYVWWLCLGLEYHLRVHGFYQQARDMVAAALNIAEHRQDILGMAVTSDLLGVLDFRIGMYDDARLHLRTALAHFRSLGNARGQAEVFYELGITARLDGRYAEARTHQGQALTLYRTLKIEHITGPSRRELGTLDRLEGKYESARQHLTFALDEALLSGDLVREARSHTELGALDRAVGDFDSARHHLRQAVSLYESYGDPPRQAEARRELGALAYAMNDHSAALTHFEAALATYAELNNEHRQADILSQLGAVAIGQGNSALAQRYWNEAIVLYNALGLTSAAGRIRDEMNSGGNPTPQE